MNCTKNADMNEQLAHAKILPLLIKLTIPVTIAQLVNALYSIVDRMYIGHMPGIGTKALTGIGLTFPIIMIIAAFSCLPGMGGAPLASIALGEGDLKKAQRYLNNALSMLIFISFIITVGCMLTLKPILIAFGANEVTLPYAISFLSIYLIGTLFVEIAMGLNPFINTQGFTGIGTITIVIGAILNIILDPIFIYVLNLGIAGAAIATVISQMISAIWVIKFLCSKKSILRLNLHDMKPDFEIIRSICALGVSPFTFRVNESIVVIILNRLLIQYGGVLSDLHIASMAILSSVGQIFFMPLIGIISGAQPILSYNMGAKNYPRLRETIYHARVLSISCAVIMWLAMMLVPNIICQLFTSDNDLIGLTSITMRIMFSTVLVLGMQMVNQNAFVAMGNTWCSFLYGIMRKLLLLVPLAFILPHIFGVWGIYMAEAISNLITTFVTYIAFTRYINNLKVRFKA
ncbi:MATE family efflux transporter [Clostridium sp. P21]|uniref:Multidrug export protein MepA n=1 Tax=Clostridium muellerianum TaxID=2716538 RepID=A0A7Y0EMX7_9CLOT|nr:MATE family efflux transporter [Clostridium muellerianum]NMM65320.1 MATE family efflux transporter [Clostridium muellerianum]